MREITSIFLVVAMTTWGVYAQELNNMNDYTSIVDTWEDGIHGQKQITGDGYVYKFDDYAWDSYDLGNTYEEVDRVLRENDLSFDNPLFDEGSLNWRDIDFYDPSVVTMMVQDCESVMLAWAIYHDDGTITSFTFYASCGELLFSVRLLSK